ncbi:hypothetical protein [Leptospira interrogans]|uniref:hypothetical protein n=1 Tax=Leptospira interrogans TaxID=173 RepID=UPI0002BC3DC9|nr:hypothetical protein [Leptospira interrogans]
MNIIDIFDKIKIERIRQERLQQTDLIPYTAASINVTNYQKIAILAEEVGEISKVLNDYHKTDADQLSSDLKLELIQAAAVCVAWLESL